MAQRYTCSSTPACRARPDRCWHNRQQKTREHHDHNPRRAAYRPRLPLLRSGDGGLRHRAALLEPDRRGQGGAGHAALDRTGDLRRRRAVLPGLVHLRRRADRGLRLRPRPPRGVGGLRGAGLRHLHEPGGAVDAGGAVHGRLSEEPRGRVRQYLAHRARFADRLLLRQLHQQLRAREDEAVDARPLAVDPHDRLDAGRRAG